jgi:hypothetical protein
MSHTPASAKMAWHASKLQVPGAERTTCQMAAPDDTTSRSPSGDPQPSGSPPEGSDGRRPLLRRIADRWNGLGPAAKAGVFVVCGVAAVGVRAFLAPSNSRATAEAAVEEEPDLPVRWLTNHAGGYYQCSHRPCGKKVNPTIMDHDCCGRCQSSRVRDCSGAAQRDYDGPGSFAHNYFEVPVRLGICEDCGESPEAHPWEFDFIHGDRRARSDA